MEKSGKHEKLTFDEINNQDKLAAKNYGSFKFSNLTPSLM